jgi:hypothetical protein
MIHEGTSIGSNQTSFTVKLAARPAAVTTVIVTVSPNTTDGVSVYATTPPAGEQLPPAITTATLTFDPDEWTDVSLASSGPTKTVYVQGVLDTDLRPDPFAIRVSSAALSVPDQFFDITEIDDNTQEIVISSATGTTCPPPTAGNTITGNDLGTVNEGGSKLSFCVSLKYQPLSNTVVDVSATANPMTTTTILTGNLSHVTFSTLDYNQPQFLSFTTGSDNDSSDEDGHVLLSSSGFAATRDLTFGITDGDKQSIVLSGGGIVNTTPSGGNGSTTWTLAVAQSAMVMVQMHLHFQPTSATTVNCTKVSGNPISVTSMPFVFTPGNYGMDQDVTFSAFSTAGTFTVTCSGTGVPAATVSVTVPAP